MRRARSDRMPIALCFLLAFTLQSSLASAQKPMSPEEEAIYRNMIKGAGIDPDQVKEARKSTESSRRWSEAKDGIVYYHIVGVYQGRANVVGDSNWIGYADATDRVEMDLAWKLADSKLVGTPTIRNSKSSVTNLRNWEPKCMPPVLKGEYEHYELLRINQGPGGNLELQVQTTYPVVEVVQQCTGSRKTRSEELTVLSPVMLDMPLPASDELRISADRKSLIQTKAGWTWTFTPSTRN